MDILTESSTPMPVKINSPGGYACRMNISAQIQGELPDTLWDLPGQQRRQWWQKTH